MIVRIATEGQYELSEDDHPGLNELDNEAVASCDAGDERAFHDVFARLLDYVRTHGRPIAEDELIGSDIILPPPGVSIEEARKEFQGEGLIPG